MSGSRRLRTACHAVAVLWIGSLLAQLAPGPGVAPAAPEAKARIQARPQPPPPVETASAALPPELPPAPESPPEPPPRAAPQTPPEPPPPRLTRVGSAELSEGADLLAGHGDFPVLSLSYEDFPSFRKYARAMVSLGARLVVVRDRQLVAAVDLVSGSIGPLSVEAAFSPRARDYSGEPGLVAVARAARDRFGRRAEVMMLVPRQLDAGLFGAISRFLAERGERHDAYREIRGRYERAPRGGVWLRVDSAVRADGSETALDLLFDLGAIARSGAAAPRPSA